MVVCFDVGNTDIVAGIYRGEKLEKMLRIGYCKGACAEEYFNILKEKFEQNAVNLSEVSGSIICCVAQNTLDNLTLAVKKLLGVNPIIFQTLKNCPVGIKSDNPWEVGADIAAACISAKYNFKMPCIVIDMGTATTVTAMDKDADIIGVSILPGVFTSMRALRNKTGLSVDESLAPPKCAIGTNTKESLASGIVLGSAYAIDGMVKAFEKELNSPCSVVATGGAAQFIIPHCTSKITLKNELLLDGLYCYYKNSIIK